MTEQSDKPPTPQPVAPSGEPESSGSEGTQAASPVEGKSLVPVVSTIPIDQKYMGAVLAEHSDARSPMAMAFAVAAFKDAETSRKLIEQHLTQTQREADRFRDLYHEESKKNAVLDERTRQSSRLSRFQLWVFAIGGLIAGVGLDAAWGAHTLWGSGGIMLVLGVVLMLVGSPLFRGSD